MDMFSFVQSESPQVFDSGLKLDIFQGEIDNVMYHGGWSSQWRELKIESPKKRLKESLEKTWSYNT